MPTKMNETTRRLNAAGLTIPGFAELLGVSHGAARKFVHGERRINATHARCLVDTLGDDGAAIVDAMNARYAELRPKTPFKAVLFDDDDYVTPSADWETWVRADGTVVYVEPDDPNDTATYTIDEWKARFGEPGMASDRHGRMWGYFATDPDYCE
jgi:hypothetical protein